MRPLVLAVVSAAIALGCGAGPAEPVSPSVPPAPPAPPALPVAVANPQAACTPVFACALADGREVSLCQAASDPLALQYRFGAPGAPELLWPEVPAAAPFRYARSTWKGTIDEVTMTRGAYAYQVFALRTEDPQNSTAGVQVSRDHALIATLNCATVSRDDLAAWGRTAFGGFTGTWDHGDWTLTLSPDGAAAISEPGPCGVYGPGRWEPTRDSGVWRNVEVEVAGEVVPVVQAVDAPRSLGLDCPVDPNPSEPDYTLHRLDPAGQPVSN